MQYIQTIIVLLVVAGAAYYLVRRFVNKLKKSATPSCNCGCSGCDAARSCDDISQQP